MFEIVYNWGTKIRATNENCKLRRVYNCVIDTHSDMTEKSYEDCPTTGFVVVVITDHGSVEESKTCTPGENAHTQK